MAAQLSSDEKHRLLSQKIDELIFLFNGDKFNVKYEFQKIAEKNPFFLKDPLALYGDFIDSKIKNFILSIQLSKAPSVKSSSSKPSSKSLGPAPSITNIQQIYPRSRYTAPEVTEEDLAQLHLDFEFGRRSNKQYKSRKVRKVVKPRKSRKVVKPRKSRKVVKSRKSRKVVKSRKSRKVVKSRKSRKVVKSRKVRKVVKSRKVRKVVKSRKSRKVRK